MNILTPISSLAEQLPLGIVAQAASVSSNAEAPSGNPIVVGMIVVLAMMLVWMLKMVGNAIHAMAEVLRMALSAIGTTLLITLIPGVLLALLLLSVV